MAAGPRVARAGRHLGSVSHGSLYGGLPEMGNGPRSGPFCQEQSTRVSGV